MLYWLAGELSKIFTPFNAFTYITMRVIMGALTAFIISLLLGPSMIRFLRRHQMAQYVRDDGPQTHLKKAGTPTMGGILTLISIGAATFLWADLRVPYVWLLLFVILAFGWIGWTDDYRKLILKNSKGMSAKEKSLWQLLFAFLVALALFFLAKGSVETTLYVPFFKNITWSMGWLFIPWVVLVITGSSNAVNLTDGLDGLAIMPVVLVAAALGVFAYAVGNVQYAQYLHLPYLLGCGEVAIFCGAIAGAGLGFLWFNAYPALVFMGDVGALALGAALATVAVMIRQELVFAVMGGLFVVEALSVIIQVTSYRLTKKRIFRMAPLHHHFELRGWPESHVTIRFWIITVILVLIGLSTLKLR